MTKEIKAELIVNAFSDLIIKNDSNPYYQVGYMLAFIKNAMMELPEFEDLLLKHIEFMKYKKKENNENNFKN